MVHDVPISRRAIIGSALGAAALTGLGAAPASAASTPSIAGTWKINANGYVGDLVVEQAKDFSVCTGTMYGEPIRGHYSAAQGIVVLFRRFTPFTAAAQVFIGQVAASGQHMAGSFFALTSAYGASQQRIEYSFGARRGTRAPSIPPPPYHSPGPAGLKGDYPLTGSFPTGSTTRTMQLGEVNPGEVGGHIDVSTFDSPWSSNVGGRYAEGTGTLVLGESRGWYPGALLVGNTDTYGPTRIGGTFYQFMRDTGTGSTLAGLWEPIAYDWSIPLP